MRNQPVDFSALLGEIEAFKPLKQVAKEVGASYSHLINIKNGARSEPSYSLGAQIIEYHQVTIEGKFNYLKARIKQGWQL